MISGGAELRSIWFPMESGHPVAGPLAGNRRRVRAGTVRYGQGPAFRSPALFGMAVLLLLCGCASAPPAINPVDWYHDIEGGPIAKKRPEIPGAEAPYPNLANVPQPPQVIPPAERDRISAALLAERTHAEQEAVLAPLPAASATAAGQAAASAAPGPAQSAAPGPAAPAATSSPGGSSSAAALPQAANNGGSAPAETEAQDQTESQQTAPPDAALAAAAAALPSVPAAPPPPPAIAGIPAAPGPPPRPFIPVQPPTLRLQFAAGSAVLTAAEQARIRALAAARGNGSVAVMGYGDAAASNAEAQAAALQLGLARASAVAMALVADGVPENALRLGAEASGGGATLRLLEQNAGSENTGNENMGT
jgi:outer membrane protein OmpA-like peptidoglycan-associated protein